MSIRKKTDKIVENIRAINELIHMRYHQLAQENNLSLDQFHLLVHLEFYEKPPTIGDIAKRSRRAQNTISERVSRLEEKGLLERIKDEGDRRISRVIMTKAGKDLMSSISYQARNEFVFKALSRIEDDIATDLLEGLDLLVENLRAEKEDKHD